MGNVVTSLSERRERLRAAALMDAAEDRIDFLDELINVLLGEGDDFPPAAVLDLLDDTIAALIGTRRGLYVAMEADGLEKYFF